MTLDSILGGAGDSDAGALAERTATVSATGPRGQSAAVLIRLTLDTCVQPRSTTGIRVIGHLPGSPDLQGTRGNVHWTGIGRPVAAAAAVPQRELRGRLRQLLPLYDENSATMK